MAAGRERAYWAHDESTEKELIAPDETPMMGIIVRPAVEAGEGAPVYIPIDMGDHMELEVRFRNVDGSERPVLVRTGGYKRLKTAKALVNYHLSYFPDVASVAVPVIPDKASA